MAESASITQNSQNQSQGLVAMLNPEQKKAVLNQFGPQLILAGAGSGKTRVLTHKVAWLVREQGFSSRSILAVTFTNKAAREMRERIEKLLDNHESFPWMGTFHSVCGRVLRMYGDRLGYTSNFTIYDTDDQKRFVKKLIKSMAGRFDERMKDTYLYAIRSLKNKAVSPEEAERQAYGPMEKRASEFYSVYQKELLKNNAMDFDDLIFQTIRLLQNHSDIKERFHRSFQYVLIDEYQDTNRAQYLLIRQLLGSHHNLVVVGDDDQSIYGWRGADINNILSFRRDYPDAAVFKLEQNYRSSGNILKAASSVICKNEQRMGKTLWTSNQDGEKVCLMQVSDELAEARWIVDCLEKETNYPMGEVAVFYRTNSQSRVLEDELRRRRIPYLIIGGIRFYDRKEVKDLLAYLRVICNPSDSVSLGRIINVPKRAIGDKTVEKYVDHALLHHVTLYEALAAHEVEGISAGVRKKVSGFFEMMEKLRKLSQELALPELVEETIRLSNYRSALETEGTDEAFDRLDNLEELISAAQDYCERDDQGGLDGFLQEIALITDQDAYDAGREAVTLMTVHAAKGLEFPRVYVAGLEDGLFPMLRSDGDGDIEEERRLFYVAATRAMKKLTLTFAGFRRRWGMGEPTMASRFLQEIDAGCVDVLQGGSESFRGTSENHQDFPAYEDFSQEPEPFHKGQKVEHRKFGPGHIVSMQGRGEDAKVEVAFFDGSRRTLILKYAKLQTLD